MNNKIIRKIPSEGETDTIFRRLCDYILPVDKEWINRIKPTSKNQIDKLRKLSRIKETGYDLPEDYLEYLKYMGENDGGLISYMYNIQSGIKELIEYYEEYMIDDPEEIHPEHLIFGQSLMGAEFYITTMDTGKRIITSNSDKIYEVDGRSESFEKLLFQYAYRIYERKYFNKVICFSTGSVDYKETLERLKVDDIFEAVDKYAEKYGFEKAWFSDKWNYIGIKGDTTFFINKLLNISGYMIGSDEKEVNELTKILNSIIGTKIKE